jgi:hypothetical protein
MEISKKIGAGMPKVHGWEL